jgi:hypothetical protein
MYNIAIGQIEFFVDHILPNPVLIEQLGVM